MLSPFVIESIGKQAESFLLILTRISVTLGMLTFFNKQMIPSRIMVIFSMTLSLFVVFMHGLSTTPPNLTTSEFYTSMLTQTLLGFVVGFVVNLFLEIFVTLGQILSLQSGLGFINLYIPKVGTVTSLSNFFLITATVLFFQLNGHLSLIKLLIESITIHLEQPIGINVSLLIEVVSFVKIIFSSGLMLSLSILIALLITNMTLGFMTKFAPQINIMSIGINITLIICFFMLYLGFDAILNNGTLLLNEILLYARNLTTKLVLS